VDFIISTPSNILGTTDGRNLTVQFFGANAVADSTAPSAYITFNKYYFKQSVKFTLASTDAVGVTNYLIYRNGSLIDTIGNTTNYTVYGLTPSTAYNFTVYARDAAGNISAVSNTATATTTRATDVPPSTPSNIVISNILLML
jgi:chitodextrinase